MSVFYPSPLSPKQPPPPLSPSPSGSTDSSPAGPVLRSREPIAYGSNRSILLLSTNDRHRPRPATDDFSSSADVSRGAGRPRRRRRPRRPCDPGRDPLAAAEIVCNSSVLGLHPHPGGSSTGVRPEITRDYTDIGEHFKYGSIGTEMSNGVPDWIEKSSPRCFPSTCSTAARRDTRHSGYDHRERCLRQAVRYPRRLLRIRRIKVFDRVSINCAACHSSTYRETPKNDLTLAVRHPRHRLNLLGYFDFLFRCAVIPGSTPARSWPRIDARTRLGPLERIIDEIAIPRC